MSAATQSKRLISLARPMTVVVRKESERKRDNKEKTEVMLGITETLMDKLVYFTLNFFLPKYLYLYSV